MSHRPLRHLPGIGRRSLLVAAAGAATMPGRVLSNMAEPPLVEVWKSPTCGCCVDWIDHLKRNGLRIKTYDSGNTAKRVQVGLAEKYGSCHTALVRGYVIEGHVPAREIHRLLKERPAALGLAVPGMPIGSPGMDTGGYAGRKDPYDVLLVRKDGGASVYQSYR